MTLDQLRIFVIVAEQQHITKAARILNMTQSAVSASVQALEQRHGVSFFDRVGRSIVLNEAGRVFLERARRVLAEARDAEAALNDLAGLKRGELSIMASQTIGAHWLPLRLGRFHGRYPGIALEVRIGNTEAAAKAVEAGTIEMALVEGRVERPALSSRKIATDEMIIVTAPDNPLGDHKPVDAAWLSAIPWVLREAGSGTRAAFENMAAVEKLSRSALDIAMVLPGNEAVLGAVTAGIGATLISRNAAAAALSAGLLKEIGYPAAPRPYFLLRHKERYRSKAAEAFETYLDVEIV